MLELRKRLLKSYNFLLFIRSARFRFIYASTGLFTFDWLFIVAQIYSVNFSCVQRSEQRNGIEICRTMLETLTSQMA